MANYILRNLINSTIYFPDIGLEVGPLEDLDVSEFNREQFSLSPTVQARVIANECVLVLSDGTQLSEDDTIRAFNNYLGNPVDIYYDQDEMNYLMVGDGSAASVNDYFYIPTSPPMKTAGEEWPGLLPLLRTKFDDVNDNFEKVGTFTQTFSKVGKFKNRYLEYEVSIPTSEIPYIIFKDSTLVEIYTSNDEQVEFYIEVYKNSVLLTTLTWTIGDAPLKSGFNYPLVKGDELEIYCGSTGKCRDVLAEFIFTSDTVEL